MCVGDLKFCYFSFHSFISKTQNEVSGVGVWVGGGEENQQGGGGGVGTADRRRRRRLRGSDLQQMGWLPSTILPFFAPFIVISSDL